MRPTLMFEIYLLFILAVIITINILQTEQFSKTVAAFQYCWGKLRRF